MLTFVGLGLWDERSITVEGKEAIRAADRAFAEFYTSRLVGTDVEALAAHHGVDIEIRDRAGVEQDPEPVLSAAADGDAVFLTGGDPMVSTTHIDLRLRAHDRGIETRVLHGTTAATAAASLTGLQNYRFGKATTLPFPDAHGGGAVPASVRDTLDANRERGLHTLVYLDIKQEREEYMTASTAAGLLADSVDRRSTGRAAEPHDSAQRRSAGGRVEPDDSGSRLGVAVCRAGSPSPLVVADRLTALADRSFGDPLHLLVVPGDLHHLEAEALRELAGAPERLVTPS